MPGGIRFRADIRPYTRFAIQYVPSPNRTDRRLAPHMKPRVALIHATVSGALEGTVRWFQRKDLPMDERVSSDFVIGKDGDIVRMVPKGYAAWHAGTCLWENKPVRWYNHLSYGLELVNWNDGKDPWPEPQLQAMAFVIASIQLECPTVNLIRRHEDVAYPTGRKTDPRGLTIDQLYRAVRLYQPGVELL